MENLNIKIFRSEFKREEIIPIYKTAGSAGMDLKAAIKKPMGIKPGERKLVPTGIGIGIDSKNYVGLIYARSGLASKKGITLSNCVGVIDSDYRGEIFCPLINLSKSEYILNPLERIAQLVISEVFIPKINIVEELEITDRGTGGFGSTGK